MDDEHAGLSANMKAENKIAWTTEIVAWEKLIENLQPGNTKSPYDSDEAGTCVILLHEPRDI